MPPPTASQPSQAKGPASSSQPAPKHPVQLSPEHHTIMLRHKLSPPTIHALTRLPRAPPPEEILRCASSATEFRSFTFHPQEKGAFSRINNDPSTRWPVRETLAQPWQKVYLVAQCEAAGRDYGDRLPLAARQDLLATKPRIVKTLGHVLRACADIMGAATRKDAAGLRRTLELWRAVAAGSWEGMPTELLQVPDIGPKKVEVLVEHGIRTVRQLAKLEFFHIERLLSRNPPFGQKIVRILGHFPRLVLHLDIPKRDHERGLIVRVVLGCSNAELPTWKGSVPMVNLAAETTDGKLVFFWRGRAGGLMSAKELVFPVQEALPGQTIFVWASCEEIAGTVVTAEKAIEI
ncbi:ATP-dependent DNA helicase MER3 [Colletotrichum siamense]|uniref:ATP-dependent DNA helicase MER3 n=1 Tax=Colletotrichum siamense TaxID=690259 RepID=UPI0018730C14|nr:ATP-dependent DNA helicase MER3 [Colletotrichum siamense]KAF5486663.1 ATP-dependent DNA helicase MER3 [Colletotrichum siamense]